MTTLARSNGVTIRRSVGFEAGASFDDVGPGGPLPVCDGSVFDDDFWAVEGPVTPVLTMAGIVVEAKPRPLGPMLMVSPFTTTVVGVAEGPIL